jgi:hypothetical protein
MKFETSYKIKSSVEKKMHIEILGRTRKDVGVLAIGIYGTLLTGLTIIVIGVEK